MVIYNQMFFNQLIKIKSEEREDKMIYDGNWTMLTERQKSIMEALKSDPNLPTKYVIKDVQEQWEGRLTVSERHVQRVRKAYKDYLSKNSQELQHDPHLKKFLGKSRKDKDVFDTATYYGGEVIKKPKKGNEKMDSKFDGLGMFPWQEELINLVNEDCYWTIDELCKEVGKDKHQVRACLNIHKDLVETSNILDEDLSGVYMTTHHPITVTKNFTSQDFKASTRKEDDFWEVEIDCVSACSKAPKEVKIKMSFKARESVKMFMHWAGAREWLAYLVGRKMKDGSVEVYDIYLPDQRTSSTLVDQVVADKYNEMVVVGVIHSHHEMGAGDEDKPSFSGHDANFINGNHDISLLAGKNGQGFKVVGIARVKTPCGSYLTVKAKVVALNEESKEQTELKKEFFAKVFGKTL